MGERRTPRSPRRPPSRSQSLRAPAHEEEPATLAARELREGSAKRLHKPVPWPDIIPAGQWAIYRSAIEAARNAGLSFMLGGGFGQAIYTGRWRNTKDIDLYILRRDRDAMIAALSTVGFVDYFDQRPYDPGWIYRSVREGIIVDIIWSMANRRAEVDEQWFQRAHPVDIREETVQLMPVEELIWCKLYILQRDHFDWTDVFNLLYSAGPHLDWDYLADRVAEDEPLLKAALTVFYWLSPNRALEFPKAVARKYDLPKLKRISAEEQQRRVRLLDTRAWFAALQPMSENLEV